MADHEGTGRLRHGFNEKNTRHNWAARKMTLKERLVESYVFNADRRVFTVHFNDAIQEQERIAVRQQLHDALDIGLAQLWRTGVVRHFLPFHTKTDGLRAAREN